MTEQAEQKQPVTDAYRAVAKKAEQMMRRRETQRLITMNIVNSRV